MDTSIFLALNFSKKRLDKPGSIVSKEVIKIGALYYKGYN